MILSFNFFLVLLSNIFFFPGMLLYKEEADFVCKRMEYCIPKLSTLVVDSDKQNLGNRKK